MCRVEVGRLMNLGAAPRAEYSTSSSTRPAGPRRPRLMTLLVAGAPLAARGCFHASLPRSGARSRARRHPRTPPAAQLRAPPLCDIRRTARSRPRRAPRRERVDPPAAMAASLGPRGEAPCSPPSRRTISTCRTPSTSSSPRSSRTAAPRTAPSSTAASSVRARVSATGPAPSRASARRTRARTANGTPPSRPPDRALTSPTPRPLGESEDITIVTDLRSNKVDELRRAPRSGNSPSRANSFVAAKRSR